MTTITMRYTKGAFLVTGKDIMARTFASRREAKDWCAGPASDQGSVCQQGSWPAARTAGVVSCEMQANLADDLIISCM